MPTVAIAFAGAAAVLFALAMLFQRTLYASAMCLLMVLLQVAVLFFLFGAELLGLMQVLVYAGAIMVLIVIAVMAAPSRLPRLWADVSGSPRLAPAVLGVLLLELTSILWVDADPYATAQGMLAPVAASPQALQTAMAAALFGRYALMTEAIGVLVLIAAVSVVQMGVEPA